MVPVFQRYENDPEKGTWGDCQQACIASILELPLDQVPHFLERAKGDDYMFQKYLQEYLQRMGLLHLEVSGVEFQRMSFAVRYKCYHLIYGKVLGVEDTWHATVGLNGRIVHDPYPVKEERLPMEIVAFGFIVPLSPWKHLQIP